MNFNRDEIRNTVEYTEFLEECKEILIRHRSRGELPNINEVIAYDIYKTVFGIGKTVAIKIENFIKTSNRLTNIDQIQNIGLKSKQHKMLKNHFQADTTENFIPINENENILKRRIKMPLVKSLPYLYKISANTCEVLESGNNFHQRLAEGESRAFLIHINVHRSNAAQLNTNLAENNLLGADFLCFSEAFNLTNDEMNLENYNYISDQRNIPLTSGGVGMCIRNHIEYDVLEMPPLADSEHLWVNIRGSNVVIGVVYRHPRQKKAKVDKFVKNFLRIMQNLTNSGLVFYILGDFNINLFEKTKFCKCFCYSICALDFKQLINKPTRHTASSGALTLIDHIYTNASTEDLEAGIIMLNISDHYPTFCSIDSSQINDLLQGIERLNVGVEVE